jgi:hypothetical protein
MKKAIFFIVIFVPLRVWALDYNDFPPALQQIIDQRTAELSSKGEIFVAGNVMASDETSFGNGNEIQVNFFQSVDAPLEIYDGGWFIMDRPCPLSSNWGPPKIILRAFGYDPIDATIAIQPGEIIYVEYVMQKTDANNLSTITGIVTDEANKPFGGVSVDLIFPLARSGTIGYPRMSAVTEPNGRYLFENLSATEYNLYIDSAEGYAGASAYFTTAKGKTVTKDLTLYPNLKIVIDYVYQADGSRDFTGGELKKGTIEWSNGNGGVDFSDGKVESYEPNSVQDIEMNQNQGELNFKIYYGNCNIRNGFYDAYSADFNSVTKAAETGYRSDMKPCIVGHTYVVKTFDNKYAKFIVRSITEEQQ